MLRNGKMKLEQLRKLIREEIETALDEAPKTRNKPSAPPENFGEFRKQFAAALRAAGASREIVSDASDLGYEGGETFGEIWQAWTEIEVHQRRGKIDQDIWLDIIDYSVHDAAINIAASQMRGRVDAEQFAQAVVEFFESGAVNMKNKPNVLPDDVNGINETIMSLLKKAKIKTRKPKKFSYASKNKNSIMVVNNDVDTVRAAVEPYFINLGFKQAEYGGIKISSKRTGTIHITFVQDSDVEDDVEIFITVSEPRNNYY